MKITRTNAQVFIGSSVGRSVLHHHLSEMPKVSN